MSSLIAMSAEGGQARLDRVAVVARDHHRRDRDPGIGASHRERRPAGIVRHDHRDRARVLGVVGLHREVAPAAVHQRDRAGGEADQWLASVGGRPHAVVHQDHASCDAGSVGRRAEVRPGGLVGACRGRWRVDRDAVWQLADRAPGRAHRVGEAGVLVDRDVVRVADLFIDGVGVDGDRCVVRVDVAQSREVEDLDAVAGAVFDDVRVVPVDLHVAVQLGYPVGRQVGDEHRVLRVARVDERAPVGPARDHPFLAGLRVGPAPHVVPGAAVDAARAAADLVHRQERHEIHPVAGERAGEPMHTRPVAHARQVVDAVLSGRGSREQPGAQQHCGQHACLEQTCPHLPRKRFPQYASRIKHGPPLLLVESNATHRRPPLTGAAALRAA